MKFTHNINEGMFRSELISSIWKIRNIIIA